MNDTRGPPEVYEYINHIVYIIEGFGMIIGNLLFILTVVLHKHLRRKELYLIVGLAIGDFLSGIGYFSGGIMRLNLVLTRTDHILRTAWECMLYFQTNFFFIGAQVTAIMMVVLSLDRLMALVWFKTYMSLTNTYAYLILGGLGVYTVGISIVAFACSYFQTDHTARIFPSICIGPWAVPKWYGVFYTSFATLGSLLSVFLYLAVLVAYMKHAKRRQQFIGDNVQAAEQQLKRQRKLTVTLGIVTLCTLIFHSIPYSFTVMMTVFKVKGFGILGPYSWMLVCVNSLINVFIYISRHPDIRAAMWAMLRCSKGRDQMGSTFGPSGTKGGSTLTTRDNKQTSNVSQNPGMEMELQKVPGEVP